MVKVKEFRACWASYAGDGGAINAYDIKAWFSENEVTI